MRALAFTASGLSLGVSAHVLAGGSPPTARVMVTLTLLVLGSARALAAGEKRLPALLAATLVVQVGVHVALLTGQPPMAGRLSMAGPAMRLTPAMLAAHGAAALVVAVLLRHAEAGVFAVRRWLVRAIRFRAARLPAVVRSVVVRPRSAGGHGLLLAAACPRRGPPALRSAQLTSPA